MGGRKASTAPWDQGDEATLIGDRTTGDDNGKGNVGEVAINGHVEGFTDGERLESKPVVRSKRKNSISGLKSKRHRIESGEIMELKLTFNQAQGLMRPPPENVPSTSVVEGFEIEEFEDAPIIGRPTIPAIDRFGEKIQWVECEDCFKWRKVPANALLPSRWTCSANIWGLDRSLCSGSQQLATEELEDILSTITEGSKKQKQKVTESDQAAPIKGLNSLANLVIKADGNDLPTSSQTTRKHTGHQRDCTCTSCIQPSDEKIPKNKQPSDEKNPKNKQTFNCAEPESQKNLFRTSMERCVKKLLAKEAESSCKSSLHQEAKLGGCLNDHDERKSSLSPLKGQIDLNIQPEREEDLSPGSYLVAMKPV